MFRWPLINWVFLATVAAVVLLATGAILITALHRRSGCLGIRKVLMQLTQNYGALSVFVAGEHEAIALSGWHLHWLDTDAPCVSFTVPLADVTALLMRGNIRKKMGFAVRLRSGMKTRVLNTRDVVQATYLFNRFAAERKAIEFLAS